jgi:hypothetical protein
LKKILYRVLAVAGVLIVLLFVSDHIDRRAREHKDATFFACHGRAVDAERRLQDRTAEGITYEAMLADIAESDDQCMERKGYTFTGDPDPRFCSSDRIPQCYSGWSLH